MNICKETVKTDSFEMDYFSFGSGNKTMVIIPGMSFKPITDCAEAVAEQCSMFSCDYTVYVFDRQKELNAGNSTVYNMTDALVQAIKRLGLSNLFVFGASQGGMMAMYMAVKYPETVNRIIVASSLSAHNSISTSRFDKWRKLASGNNPAALVEDVYSALYSKEFYENNKENLLNPANYPTREEMDRFALLSNACYTFDLHGEISKIKCPVLVIGAENDKVMGAKGSYDIAKKLGCEIYMYKDAEHAVYDEAPDYKERIKKFFAE